MSHMMTGLRENPRFQNHRRNSPERVQHLSLSPCAGHILLSIACPELPGLGDPFSLTRTAEVGRAPSFGSPL
jgi:hypothetical protein